MRLTHRLTAAATVLVLGPGLMIAPRVARASEEGRRNTALALGAAAAYLLVKERDKLPGIVAAAGAAYAYKRYDDKVKERHRWERYGYYDDCRYEDRYRDRDDRYRYGRYDRDRDRYGRYDDRYKEDCYDRDRDYRSRDRSSRYSRR